MHVETVGALTPDQRAVIPRHFAVRTAAVEGHPADPTVVIVGHPEPGGNPVPLFDFHLHPADKAATTVSFRYLTLVRLVRFLAKNKSFRACLTEVYNIKVMMSFQVYLLNLTQ